MSTFVPTNEQKAIIEYPQIPLRVVAGAGTGKTTTIVERLAQTARDGGDPTRALGITFTNKAADELRSRLRSALDDNVDGREVEVSTYHGFASSILDEFGAFAGYGSGASLMDEGHRSELAYRTLHGLDATDLDLSSLPQRRDDLLAIADTLTSNLLEPATVRSLAPKNMDDVWTKRVALLHAVENYEAAKRALNFLEYGDLIKHAVEIVEGFPNIAAQITARYDAVLLDEYQDTDPAQRRLLAAVFSHGIAVTAVGDSDQTIYEWRGASLENFERFPEHFPTPDGSAAQTLPLSINRRSDKAILELANAIQKLLPRLEASKPLAPRPRAKAGAITTAWFRTDDHESTWIADEIRERHEDGVAWSDVAILCRKRSAIPSIVRALRDADIPFSVSSMGELLDIPEVADLLAWLRVLSAPDDEPSLLRIWMGGMFRIGMRDISRMRAWCKGDTGRNLALALEHLNDIDGLSASGRARLDVFVELHRDLHTSAQVMSVPAILGKTIDRLGFWDEVAAQGSGHAVTARINIGRFVALANNWRPLDGSPTLEAFLRYINALDDAKPAEELEAAGDISGDLVQVITAHASKGLEWPVVFLPSLGDGTFPSNVRIYDDPDRSALKLPYALRLDKASFTEADNTESGDRRRAVLKSKHDAAEWRLAYVAVTRAKHELLMSGHAWDRDITKPRSPSDLLTIANDLEVSNIATWADDPGDKPEPTGYEDTAESPDPLFFDGWADALRKRISDPHWIDTEYPDIVEAVDSRSEQLTMQIANLPAAVEDERETSFSTSVTNLVALAECPLKFKWIHHDRLPRRPRISALKGTQFHRQVELHNRGVVALDEANLDRYPSLRSDAREDKQDTKDEKPGSSDPWQTFNDSRFVDVQPRFVEVPFVLELDTGALRGKIDAIYESDDNAWEVVDYKSGSRRDGDAKNVQLQAYALAVNDGAVSRDTPDTMAVTFAYFGGSTCEETTAQVTDEWLADARDNVSQLLDRAQEGPFEAEPSPACRYCDFLHHCEPGQTSVKKH